MSKSQVLSVDIIIALLGFIGIIVFLIWGWQSVTISITEFDQSQDLYSIAYFVSESLVSEPGLPADWNTQVSPLRSDISTLGLKNGSFISIDKITHMADTNDSNYQTYKEILGVLGPNYNIQIEYFIDDGNSFVKNESLTFGMITDTSNIASFSRIAILDDISSNSVRMVVKVSGGDS